jgi:hypothetical protein
MPNHDTTMKTITSEQARIVDLADAMESEISFMRGRARSNPNTLITDASGRFALHYSGVDHVWGHEIFNYSAIVPRTGELKILFRGEWEAGYAIEFAQRARIALVK